MNKKEQRDREIKLIYELKDSIESIKYHKVFKEWIVTMEDGFKIFSKTLLESLEKASIDIKLFKKSKKHD